MVTRRVHTSVSTRPAFGELDVFQPPFAVHATRSRDGAVAGSSDFVVSG
jgi:hypothetical protein